MSDYKPIPAEWLDERTTVAELLARLDNPELPNSFREIMTREILSFTTSVGPQDELWIYSSSDESWEHLCGSWGLAILRDGKIACHKLFAMN
jgi:hypothetical protein